MNAVVEFFRFATSDFWTFVGCAILLSILTDGAGRWLTFSVSLIRNAQR